MKFFSKKEKKGDTYFAKLIDIIFSFEFFNGLFANVYDNT